MAQMVSDPPVNDPAPGRYTPRERRRALLVLAGITAVLLLIFFSDTLSGLVPHAPYHPQPVVAGSYHVQLALDTTQPRVAQPLHATITVANAHGQPVLGAQISYQWTMPTMLMDPITGLAAPATQNGTYAATITGEMSGSWQLLVSVHSPTVPDATATFDIPISQ